VNLPRHTVSKGGFTLLELVVSFAILALLSVALSGALSGMNGLATGSSAGAQIQDAGERAMRLIRKDLQRSGFTTTAASYPYLFLDGAANAPFAGHAHAPPTHHAKPGDPDYGPNREIVFLQPQDADQDDVPDIDANGELIWDATEFSYVLITGVDGVNYLQRRIDGVAPRTIASNVERVTFDDNTTSGFAVPLDAVRVRLYFRKRDSRGVLHRHLCEAIVKLRNG
jgi:prepilin-type N-terminal cleavage/methylation domain-containing protein